MTLHTLLPQYLHEFDFQTGLRCTGEITFINTAYRKKPVGVATGGPNGVLFLQETLLGPRYRGYPLRYFYSPEKLPLPPLWKTWMHENKIATMSRNLLESHYFVQHYLSKGVPQQAFTKESNHVHFVCHDIGSATAAHLCGYPFTLIYHQQGAFIHERISFGEDLNYAEQRLMNYFEKIAFEKADRVYFPSEGAKKAFLTTTTAVEEKNISFGEFPLYNTVYDFNISQNSLLKFLKEHGLGHLLAPTVRSQYLIFVSIGDYTPNKGIDRCPDVITKIAQATSKKIIWICMGSKHKSGIYEKLKEDQENYPFKMILIPQRQPHAETMAILQFSDWLLMLQRHSIFDFSTLEAMQLGKGVILSPIGGNLEFNKENNIVYIDPDTDGKYSIDKITNEAIQYGELNKKTFQNNFSPEIFCKTYLHMYDDIIERKGVTPTTHKPFMCTEDMHTIREILHDKKIIICGPGASLSRLAQEETKGKYLIALNSALLSDFEFDMHIMQDEPRESSFWGVYLSKQVKRIYGTINRTTTASLKINFEQLDQHSIPYLQYNLAEEVFDIRYRPLDLNLEDRYVEDMLGVLFSSLQICTWAGASSIELAGIDFSSENFNGANPSKYNPAIFINLMNITKKIAEKEIPFTVLHTDSVHVEEIITSKGTQGLPERPSLPIPLSKFQQRLLKYGPIRRMIVKWGQKLLPASTAKNIDNFLKKLKVL